MLKCCLRVPIFFLLSDWIGKSGKGWPDKDGRSRLSRHPSFILCSQQKMTKVFSQIVECFVKVSFISNMSRPQSLSKMSSDDIYRLYEVVSYHFYLLFTKSQYHSASTTNEVWCCSLCSSRNDQAQPSWTHPRKPGWGKHQNTIAIFHRSMNTQLGGESVKIQKQYFFSRMNTQHS